MKRLLTIGPEAHRAIALHWFMQGFAATGRSFHGENYDLNQYPALVSLLTAHFDRLYNGSSDRSLIEVIK